MTAHDNGTPTRMARHRARLLRAGLSALGAVLLFLSGLGAGAWFADRPDGRAVAPQSTAASAKPAPGPVPLPRMTARPEPAGAVAPAPSSQTVADQAVPPPAALREPAELAAWERHAAASVVPAGAPMIAIILDDLGIDRRRSARAVALPAPLTLAYLPYAEDLAAQTAAARARGHELLVHVPMQPQDHNSDPGPNVLDMRLGGSAVGERLRWNLGRFEGYVGINNHMGSLFTESEQGMRIVAADLRERGLLFLDSLTSANSVALRVAEEAGVAATVRDVFLDNTDTVAEVEFRLAQTERIARRNGTAIAIGHPRDATLDVLSVWVERARAEGFALVPLTRVLRERRQGARQRSARQQASR